MGVASIHKRWIFALGCLILGAGCSFKGPNQPSVLLIFVENLGLSSVICSDSPRSEELSGFQVMCAESIRFTHSYTPSLLSQSAISSILSARHTVDHGVWNNGGQYLSAKIETAPEVALRRGFRTSFFSGGAPIWRKSGFAQGFEVFDDNVQPSLKGMYRGASEVAQQFLSWVDTEAAVGRFFSALYFADLQFIDTSTTNDAGEIRENSYRSQLLEIDETLHGLIQGLQAKKLWDSTTVFLVGLNGQAIESQSMEPSVVNLMSESTRVVTMIKPARKATDGPLTLKMDGNISLVDIGATLYDYLGSPVPEASDSRIQPFSLMSVLEKSEMNIPNDHVLLISSGWSSWRMKGKTRIALRQGPYLYIHDSPPKIYNTISDSQETTSLGVEDMRYGEIVSSFSDVIKKFDFLSWTPLDRISVEKIQLGQLLWQNRDPSPEVIAKLKSLVQKYPLDFQLKNWLASVSLRMARWEDLIFPSEKSVPSQPIESVWKYIAHRNLGREAVLPSDPCFKYLEERKSNPGKLASLRECNSEMIIELVTWLDDSLPAVQRQRAMEVFLRLYSGQVLDERIARENFVVGLTWDVSLQVPSGPNLADLILALPEHKKTRVQVNSRMSEFMGKRGT